MDPTVCPTDEQLLKCLGAAPGLPDVAAVADHVQGCRSCQERLPQLVPDVSAFGAAPKPAGPSDPVLAQAVVELLREPPAGRLAPGHELREYRIIESLGAGGMGTVYRALHTRLGKEVALKVVAPARRFDPEALSRFEREMKAVGRLRHPNIVQATDAGDVDGTLFLVMELVPGRDLARVVKEHGPLRPADACEAMRQAALGLQHAHQNGLIHRDVKPGNLMLTPDGQVKILDLGLALFDTDPAPAVAETAVAPALAADHDTDVSLTHTHHVVGTAAYMAPEQRLDPRTVDAKADAYGLGCTLWFLLVGKPPTRAESGPPESIRGHRPEMSRGIERLLARLLARDPAARATMMEAARDLRRYTGGHDLPALLGQAPRPRRRHRSAVTVLAVALLAGVAASTPLWWPKSRPQVTATEPPSGQIPMTEVEARELQQRWATHLGEPVEVMNSVGMQMVLIPPGEIPLNADFRVPLTRAYRIGNCETTVGQFRQFVTATGHKTEAEVSGRGGQYLRAGMAMGDAHSPQQRPEFLWHTPGHETVTDDHPVTQVAWNDAAAFCRWLGEREKQTYRLPTEAEWRWAAQAGETSDPFAEDKKILVERAWCLANAGDQPRPVGRLKPNAWGLYDMLGNVEERAHDWFAVYPVGTAADYRGPDPPEKNPMKLRLGTSHMSIVGRFDRRPRSGPGSASSHVGFRIVCMGNSEPPPELLKRPGE